MVESKRQQGKRSFSVELLFQQTWNSVVQPLWERTTFLLCPRVLLSLSIPKNSESPGKNIPLNEQRLKTEKSLACFTSETRCLCSTSWPEGSSMFQKRSTAFFLFLQMCSQKTWNRRNFLRFLAVFCQYFLFAVSFWWRTGSLRCFPWQHLSSCRSSLRFWCWVTRQRCTCTEPSGISRSSAKAWASLPRHSLSYQSSTRWS